MFNVLVLNIWYSVFAISKSEGKLLFFIFFHCRLFDMQAKGWLLALTKQEALINKENYKSWLFGR